MRPITKQFCQLIFKNHYLALGIGLWIGILSFSLEVIVKNSFGLDISSIIFSLICSIGMLGYIRLIAKPNIK